MSKELWGVKRPGSNELIQSQPGVSQQAGVAMAALVDKRLQSIVAPCYRRTMVYTAKLNGYQIVRVEVTEVKP